jgi:hypothetical protein
LAAHGAGVTEEFVIAMRAVVVSVVANKIYLRYVLSRGVNVGGRLVSGAIIGDREIFAGMRTERRVEALMKVAGGDRGATPTIAAQLSRLRPGLGPASVEGCEYARNEEGFPG